ncbi:hypothetical protein VFPFJ_02252 [Purpureocillium lilacinum]|uniref:Uncharacterized protein n=2 Tax=Purpureocillium lilacinum TaxID=33203 RepID=A0A179HU42_PURLI|nr:hypothetical protein VFPFJ_02252 [Purpureocillium lilacinum]OAQ93091.1 hypothetical protein VFPFJ_02252 [Purpureocillium lilacinum]
MAATSSAHDIYHGPRTSSSSPLSMPVHLNATAAATARTHPAPSNTSSKGPSSVTSKLAATRGALPPVLDRQHVAGPLAAPAPVPDSAGAPSPPANAPGTMPIAAEDGTFGVPENVPANAPANLPVNAPANGLANAPVNGQVNAPVNGPSNAPANGPSNAPANGPSNAPANGPASAPANGPPNVPLNGPAQPAEEPVEVPINEKERPQSPSNTLINGPEKVPVNAPYVEDEAPKRPSTTPINAPARAPAAAPPTTSITTENEAPRLSAPSMAKTPVVSPTAVVDDTARLPADTHSITPVRAPAKESASLPGYPSQSKPGNVPPVPPIVVDNGIALQSSGIAATKPFPTEARTPPANASTTIPLAGDDVPVSPLTNVPAVTPIAAGGALPSPPGASTSTTRVVVEEIPPVVLTNSSTVSSAEAPSRPTTVELPGSKSTSSLSGGEVTTPTDSATLSSGASAVPGLSETIAQSASSAQEQSSPASVTSSTSTSVPTSSVTSTQATPQEPAKSPTPDSSVSPPGSPTPETSEQPTPEPVAPPRQTATLSNDEPLPQSSEAPRQESSQRPDIEATQGNQPPQRPAQTPANSSSRTPASDSSPAVATQPRPTQGTDLGTQPKPPQNPAISSTDVGAPTPVSSSSSSTVTQTTLQTLTGSTADGAAAPISTSTSNPSTTRTIDPFSENQPHDNNNPTGDHHGGAGNHRGGGSDIVPPATSSTSSSGGLSKQSIIGISVGGFAALALIALLIWAWRKRAAKKRRRSENAQIADQLYGSASEKKVAAAAPAPSWVFGPPAAWLPHRDNVGRSNDGGSSLYTEAPVPAQNVQPANRHPMLGKLTPNFGADWWRWRAGPGNGSNTQQLPVEGNQRAAMPSGQLDVGANLGFSLQGSGTFDPFSDAHAASAPQAYMPAQPLDRRLPADPFADSAAVLGPSVHRRSKSRKGSVTYAPTIPPRARGRSLNATTGGFQNPPLQPASRAHSMHRESTQSAESFSERRNKFRSDPFDLELQGGIMPSATALAQMPRNTAASSMYSTQTRHGSPSSSRYTSGVSASDVGEAGPVGVAPGRRSADSPTLADMPPPPPPPRARTRPPGAQGTAVTSPGMAVGQAL